MSKNFILVMAAAAAACGGDDTGTIAGSVTGAAGPLNNAEVTAAGKTAATAADGSYEIADVAPGTVDVSVVADWYTDGSQSAEVAAGETATVDLQLTPMALGVEAADAALATTFNASADWTHDTVSIVHVTAPTRALFDFAVHYRNPALYRDPGSEDQVTPPVLPSVATPSTLNFEVDSGIHDGEQALDIATVVDDVTDTPYGGTPADGVVLWDPALHYLATYWSRDDSTPLVAAGVAVRKQKWGGTGIMSIQEIERTHLHDGDIWVEVVFQDFVDLDLDIIDADGDGLREIWARINPIHFDATLYAELRDAYVVDTFGTLELVGVLRENLDRLYARGLNANIINTIGVPYTHVDLGTVEYPFAVVLYGTIAVANVFLVEP